MQKKYFFLFYSNVKRNFDGCMAKLSSTVAVLQSLSVLKRTYNITLMYDDYVNVCCILSCPSQFGFN